MVYTLVVRESAPEASAELPTEAIPIMDEFHDIFPNDLQDELPL